MVYLGSKSKIAEQIVSLLVKNQKGVSNYVELFCGGCSVAESITSLCFERILLNDVNPYLIAILEYGQRGGDFSKFMEVPSKEDWQWVKDHKDDDLIKTGIYGFMLGFKGFFFEGYHPYAKERGNTRNLYRERFENFLKTINKLRLKKVEFSCSDYREFQIPDNSLVYCDPPYNNTKIYAGVGAFNHLSFWEWVRENSSKHKIVVSELEAPSDFECILECPIRYSTSDSGRDVVTEKLFVHSSQVDKWKTCRKSFWV